MTQTGRASVPLVGGVLAAAVLFGTWWMTRTPVEQPVPPPASQSGTTNPATETAAPANNTTTVRSDNDSSVLPGNLSGNPAGSATGSGDRDPPQVPQPALPDPQTDADLAADTAGLTSDELADIGTAAYSDGEFELLQQLIRDNPVVLEQLLQIFRANTDPDRADRLAELLGQFDHPAITELGSELALSGELASQKAGLGLLGRQQVHSPAAREAVQQVLDVETNPDVLVPALNAVARPSRVNAVERRRILDQLSILVTHEDPRVRSHSYTLIKGWSKNENMNQVLLRGLEDNNASVRKSATFSLLNTRHPNDAVKRALLSRVEDVAESKRTREAAYYALKRYALTAEEQSRFDTVSRNINQLQ